MNRSRVDWVSMMLGVALAALLTPVATELWQFLRSDRLRETAATFFHQSALLQSSVLALGFCLLFVVVQAIARSKLDTRDTFDLALRGIVLGYLTTFLVSILLGTTRDIYAAFEENGWAYGLEALSLILYLLVDSIAMARDSSPRRT